MKINKLKQKMEREFAETRNVGGTVFKRTQTHRDRKNDYKRNKRVEE